MTAALPSGTIVDPRVARTRQAVIDAAVDLLIDGGPAAVTIDAIVTRSRVAKSTIYRHWDTRDDVLIDVLHACGPTLPEPAEDLPVADALRELLYGVVAMTNDPQTSRVIRTMVLLRFELDGVQDLEQRLEKEQADTIDLILQRGVAQGAIAPGYDVREVTAHLIGPLFFAHLSGALPADQALADQSVEFVIGAYGTT